MNILKILFGKRARKAPFATLSEVLRMRFGSQRLLFQEYIDYRLHELDDLSAEERGKFLGNGRKFRLNYVCNDARWFMLGEKLPMTLFMMATGLPMPKIHAVYDLDGRNLPGAITLNSVDETAVYLRTLQHYPLFAKPSRSAYGWGAQGLQNYLPESDSIVFLNGKQRNVMEWIKSLNPKFSHGILFQEQLKPHPEIARVCGLRVSSIRVTSARINGRNTIVSAVWRIPVGSNMVDNFQHGTSGNLLGGVNITNGQITRVVGKINGKIEAVATHPDTSVQFDLYTLPDWPQLTEICERAANYLMGMNLHHWDIALTERGPVIIENNEIADLDLHQHANRKGFWSEEIETSTASILSTLLGTTELAPKEIS
ncbi:Sugar-transfer associated ATP-grasp [Nitrosomonas eutropha]|uniref:Sugar-transfer associated ATP-grasp n=1 Tax=Nitrosomonas eutropha TaxID=916 RepID=A0A1I7GT34_9PROT|nr:sugar-transfer associated ATP-grasp domain-containing protein [Nitrosomonas eutropha]SFU51594.1 Sugar-transfer associated ATP-grasp [Nitrosomonas eutropha]